MEMLRIMREMILMMAMMRIIRQQMLQGELLISWVSGLDRVEEQPWMGEVVSLTIMMMTMMTMMMMTIMTLPLPSPLHFCPRHGGF